MTYSNYSLNVKRHYTIDADTYCSYLCRPSLHVAVRRRSYYETFHMHTRTLHTYICVTNIKSVSITTLISVPPRTFIIYTYVYRLQYTPHTLIHSRIITVRGRTYVAATHLVQPILTAHTIFNDAPATADGTTYMILITIRFERMQLLPYLHTVL